jgi:hypothetical protein
MSAKTITSSKAVRQQAKISRFGMKKQAPLAIAPLQGLQRSQWLTTTPVQEIPRFRQEQRVSFVGGTGIIRHCRPASGTWTYTVEMELGAEPPDVGRVGHETQILLYEADIHEVLN